MLAILFDMAFDSINIYSPINDEICLYVISNIYQYRASCETDKILKMYKSDYDLNWAEQIMISLSIKLNQRLIDK